MRCAFPFLQPWTNHSSLRRVASATPDLRLPSQPQGITPFGWYQIIPLGERGTCACKQLACGCHRKVKRPGVDSATLESRVHESNALNHYTAQATLHPSLPHTTLTGASESMISGAREWTGLLTYLLPLVSGAPVDWTWFGQSAIGVQYLAASARAVSSRRPPAPSHAFRERARSDCASSGSPAGGGTRAPPGRATSAQRPRPASNHDQMWRCSLPGQTDASPSPSRSPCRR